MLATFTSSLKHYLFSGQFQHPQGFKVGFMTFDKTLHFYNIRPGLDQYQMLVVADIEDVFTPMQDGLCVEPNASRTLIESLLDALPNMFRENRTTESAMGSACKAAFEALVNYIDLEKRWWPCLCISDMFAFVWYGRP